MYTINIYKNYIRYFQDRFVDTAFSTSPTEAITDNTQATTGLVYIPDGGFVSSNDDSSVINSMYATLSGLIVFTNYKNGDTFVQRALASPSADRCAGFPKYGLLTRSGREIVSYWEPIGYIACLGLSYVRCYSVAL